MFTRDEERIAECSEALRFGEVQVNGVKYAIELPHGGVKQSGVGHDCSVLALDDYLVHKRISRPLDPATDGAQPMKITKVTSHVLQYDLDEELGYSQQYYSRRTAHLVEVHTDDGLIGWGECFGPGNVALANQVIVEKVIAPMIVGSDPRDREVLWHRVYNLLRDHGQKGMPIQALSGVDIALWDLFGKMTEQPLHQAPRRRLSVACSRLRLRHDADSRTATWQSGWPRRRPASRRPGTPRPR